MSVYHHLEAGVRQRDAHEQVSDGTDLLGTALTGFAQRPQHPSELEGLAGGRVADLHREVAKTPQGPDRASQDGKAAVAV